MNSCVLVIIREPQQALLNYRSHQHDRLRLGHCNTGLIIYSLYYSKNYIEKVSIFPLKGLQQLNFIFNFQLDKKRESIPVEIPFPT